MRMGVSRINAQGMLEDLGEAPEGAIVLLHACAHVRPSPSRDAARASHVPGLACAHACMRLLKQ